MKSWRVLSSRNGQIIESGSELWLRGTGMDLGTKLKYESGVDNWTVRCKCGAQDDGERIVTCEIFEIWHHSRCSGMRDSSPKVYPDFI